MIGPAPPLPPAFAGPRLAEQFLDKLFQNVCLIGWHPGVLSLGPIRFQTGVSLLGGVKSQTFRSGSPDPTATIRVPAAAPAKSTMTFLAGGK